ncbi:MAG TPA: hypothetical protein VH228_17805 [Nocardioides sp.]|jgi:hypothetical protein|nr:hypothetical protein [Nocardioides sp.]
MPDYVVVSRIALGVKDDETGAVNHYQYEQGDVVTLDEEAGKQYVAEGAVRPVDDNQSDSGSSGSSSESSSGKGDKSTGKSTDKS